MSIRPGMKDAFWMVPGVLTLLLLLVVVFHFYRDHDAAAQVAARTKRIDLVAAMRLDLAAASEAGKSAVSAATDKNSQTFADQARAATASVEAKRRELANLLSTDGTSRDRELLAQFEKAFGEFQRIDGELLGLSVKNTNIKAFKLAFGPAAAAVSDMDVALSQVAARGSGSTGTQRLERFANGARIAALRIQALLAPHIAEESDPRMDELEAQMTKEDEEVKRDLAELVKLKAGPQLDTAEASYARFGELRAQILSLSRENTNVRSLALSLDQDRKVTLECQDALASLQRAILEDPIAGVTYGEPARPR